MKRPKGPSAATQDPIAESLAAARQLGAIAGEQRWLDGEPRMDEVMQRITERPIEGPDDRGARDALTWLVAGGVMATARTLDADELLASAQPVALTQPVTSSAPPTIPEAAALPEPKEITWTMRALQDALSRIEATDAITRIVVIPDPTEDDPLRVSEMKEWLRTLAREAGGCAPRVVLYVAGHGRTFSRPSLNTFWTF